MLPAYRLSLRVIAVVADKGGEPLQRVSDVSVVRISLKIFEFASPEIVEDGDNRVVDVVRKVSMSGHRALQ